MSRSFELGFVLVPLDEESSRYRSVRQRYFAAIMVRHPDVWRMHKTNKQFEMIEGVIAKKAVQHCAAQAARARVLAHMLGLNEFWTVILEKAAFLHDSFKGEEVRYMRRHGPSWDTYDAAQKLARKSWEATGLFTTEVMDVAGSVAHESLADMLRICGNADALTPLERCMLAMHLLDDTAVEDDWAVPVDADGKDIIQVRMDK